MENGECNSPRHEDGIMVETEKPVTSIHSDTQSYFLFFI
jgi:hypothetical protein